MPVYRSIELGAPHLRDGMPGCGDRVAAIVAETMSWCASLLNLHPPGVDQ